MRIAIVSAHYPPDFVSGGTLVPQQHARGLRARGHDVRVFAGSLAVDRQADAPWDDVDGTGLPVRWVPVREGIAWSDDRNAHNPRVAAAFADWLTEVRPEVVHLHSLQAMGGELVRIAKQYGARTVVTAHDFWWTCGRQFLVDKGFQPCSLVVEAGGCGCEVDRGWLDVRNAHLASQLAFADVVCAPSSLAREVLAANGLAPGALVVDENALVPVASAATTSDTVRFLYAGGKNRVKGVAVALEAAGLLGPGAWSLSAFGCAEHRELVDPALPVSFPDPYDPSELPTVLGQHDVLVLPSLMRESFSILTREALLAGMTVITSDCLGPEEVVRHGVNGLVVPAGRPDQLAAAMRALVEDRALLSRLRAVPPPPVRSPEEQLDGLEELYASALLPRPRGTVKHVLFVVGIEGAPLRYRVRLPAEALALLGITSDVRHYRDPDLAQLVARADVVVVYRVPATRQLLDLIAGAAVPVLFDVDDLIVDPSLEDEIPALRLLDEDGVALWMEGVRRYRTTLEACDAYIGSTDLLCDHIGALTGLPTHRFSNGVGVVTGRRSDAALRRDRRPGPLRVGYLSGTTTHDRDWQAVEPAVLEALARHPEAELWLVGHLNATEAVDALGARLHRLPLQDWRELPELLRDLDVNLAPLELDLGAGGRFNEAKSAIKQLEAALVETPTVATPTQPFREAITPGVNGLLASTHDEWVTALDDLLSDPSLRARLGARARRDALLSLSPHLQAQRYLEVLEAARARGLTRRPSTFEPVALDGPPARVRLEPYTSEPVAVPTRLERWQERAGDVQLRVRELVRRDGYAGISRAVLKRARARLRA